MLVAMVVWMAGTEDRSSDNGRLRGPSAGIDPPTRAEHGEETACSAICNSRQILQKLVQYGGFVWFSYWYVGQTSEPGGYRAMMDRRILCPDLGGIGRLYRCSDYTGIPVETGVGWIYKELFSTVVLVIFIV